VRISGTAGCAVLYGSLAQELELLNVSGIADAEFLPPQIKPGMGATAEGLVGDRIQILVGDGEGKEWATIFTQAAKFYPSLVVLIPLVAENRTVGLLVLACHRPYLTPQRRKMLELFRTYVSPYLQNALLHKRIQEIASEDGLTGCLNRRFGMRRLHEEFSLAVRNNGKISVVLLDIDHFKKINDSYGHAAGDFVLKEVAAMLQENARTGEVVCRYGGEEFLIVAPGGSLDETGLLAERLRKLVEGKVLQWAKDVLQVTISFGVATWPDGGTTVSAEELVNEADEALYFAKESGRNLTAVNRGGQARLFDSEVSDK
jgi:diguanylate cyclase (GGDEF)-like protein